MSKIKVSKPRAAAVKQPRPTIRECPTFEACRVLRTTCETCQELDVPAWKEHVRAVLARHQKEGLTA